LLSGGDIIGETQSTAPTPKSNIGQTSTDFGNDLLGLGFGSLNVAHAPSPKAPVGLMAPPSKTGAISGLGTDLIGGS
jgi:hypothetical protein